MKKIYHFFLLTLFMIIPSTTVLTMQTMALTDIGNVLRQNNRAEFSELFSNTTVTDSLYIDVLHWAVRKQEVEAARLLLDNGTDPNARDSSGRTSLHWAAYVGDRTMVEIVMSYPIDVNAVDEDGATPLDTAQYFKHAEIVEALMARGGDINVSKPSRGGWLPLHRAAAKGDKEKIEILLSRKVEVNGKCCGDFTALHLAAENGHTQVVELLVGKGALVNARNGEGQTPLFLAIINGHEEVAGFLLTQNDDTILIADNHGNTPLHVVLTRTVSGKRDPYSDVHRRVRVAELLVHKGALISARNSNGQTPLHVAIKNRHEEVARFLLTKKDVGISIADNDGCTPLHCAVLMARESAVRLLLANNPDLQAQDKDGNTPLHVAVRENVPGRWNRYHDIIKLLLEHGAEVTIRNAQGKTAPDLSHFDFQEQFGNSMRKCIIC